MAFAAETLLRGFVLIAIAAEQSALGDRAMVGPHFSEFPVAKVYGGPIAKPNFKSASEEQYLGGFLSDIDAGPNFSGQFRIVQFRVGSGPPGAVVIDSRTGSIYRLPHEIAQDAFFIHRTDCLAALRGLQWAKAADEDDGSAPLSFKSNSELLIVRQCRVDGTAVERRYYRWYGLKWHFLKRLASPRPPVF